MKPYPTFQFELPYWQENTYVIGLDEVGRGCLAGPVHVGGVCFPFLSEKDQKKIKKLKIHDSKLCTAKKRALLAPKIKELVLCSKVASSTVEEINTMGIVPAIEKAATIIIREIAAQLPSSSLFIVFTDTLPIKSLKNSRTIKQIAIPQADSNTVTVAAASIIAKVDRDELMIEHHKSYPNYNWNVNKGYSTKSHCAAILAHGRTALHRNLYLRKLLDEM